MFKNVHNMYEGNSIFQACSATLIKVESKVK